MTRPSIAALTIALSLASAAASAASVMPDFSTIPTGWATDRYAPASFSDVGTYQGRSDVLGIGISSPQSFTNRPAAYQGTFYNTQGMQHAITGGAGSFLTADLFIDAGWRNAANGNVRTDMWGVMTDGLAVSDYPIIGFTNYDGGARFRVWDDAGWHDLATTVNFGAWTSLEILFSGTSYDYFINGASVYTDTATDGSTGFSAVIMQAYNFGGDPTILNAVASDYTAYWSNSETGHVPEPGTAALFGLALLGVVGSRRRKA